MMNLLSLFRFLLTRTVNQYIHDYTQKCTHAYISVYNREFMDLYYELRETEINLASSSCDLPPFCLAWFNSK